MTVNSDNSPRGVANEGVSLSGPRDYTAGTRAALATLSKGRCYYPDCAVPVIVFVGNDPIINYEIAHIRDAKPGNRFVPAMTDAERKAFNNLVLLCGPHHKYVDRQKPELFSIETLQGWKDARETGGVAELRGLDGLTEDKLFQMIQRAVAAGTVKSPSLDWNMDEDEFEDQVADVLGSSDDIAIRRFLERAENEWQDLIKESVGSVVPAHRLLDRLTCLAACSIRWDRSEWACRAVDTLVVMYSTVVNEVGDVSSRLIEPECRLLTAIINRVLGLGAVAVDAGAWRLINNLIFRTPAHMPKIYTNWICHATTSASRADDDSAGATSRSSYLETALHDIGGLHCLNSDAPDIEKLRNRLAGFDVLATISTWHRVPKGSDPPYFPWHRAYEGHRYENAIALVITNLELREAIFPGDDQQLAQLLLRLEQFGIQHMARFGGGWRYVNPTIQIFVAQERERQHREQLLDKVRRRAAHTGAGLPLSREGRRPAIVTYTNGDKAVFVPDLETYKQLMSSGAINPQISFFALPPQLISDWSTDDLQAWLDKSLGQ